MIEAEIAPDLAVVKATGEMIGRGRGSELSIETAGAGADLLKVVDTAGVIATRMEVQVVDIRLRIENMTGGRGRGRGIARVTQEEGIVVVVMTAEDRAPHDTDHVAALKVWRGRKAKARARARRRPMIVERGLGHHHRQALVLDLHLHPHRHLGLNLGLNLGLDQINPLSQC